MFEQKLHFPFEATQRILQQIAYIDQFKGKWEILEQKENIYLKELRRIATIQSVGSSTRIEGAILTDEEVKQLLNDVTITTFETRDEQEVAGYYDVLELILDHVQDIQFSENMVKQLHSLLLKYSDKDTRHRGEYKNLPNTVTARYPDGTTRIIFEPTPPYLVKMEMERLVTWTSEALTATQIHPLLVVGAFVYEFLSIHPFQDGNGRLSRLLTTMLLLQHEYHFVQYISFEHIIEERKRRYYEVLMECQHQRSPESAEQIDVWMEFFLECIITLIQRLEHKYAHYQQAGAYLNPRQRRVLTTLQEVQPAKMSDIHAALHDVPLNTLKKDVKYLVEQRRIEKIGKKRGTIYLLPNEKAQEVP
ncbi:MAG: Fic family protein [bacterium]|nr:Fic family protein [bacterium]